MMMVDLGNAKELATIAREVGAEVLEGDLSYPSESGGWQLGDVDLSEYLAQYRNHRLVLILVPTGEAQTKPIVCGICGFVMTELQNCPRCKLITHEAARALEARQREQEQLFEEIQTFLNREQDETP